MFLFTFSDTASYFKFMSLLYYPLLVMSSFLIFFFFNLRGKKTPANLALTICSSSSASFRFNKKIYTNSTHIVLKFFFIFQRTLNMGVPGSFHAIATQEKNIMSSFP